MRILLVCFALSLCVMEVVGQEPDAKKAPKPNAAEKNAEVDLKTYLDKLASAEPEVRREAVVALGRLGPKAAPAISALVAALALADGELTFQVEITIKRIGEPAIPEVVKGLTHVNVEMRFAFLQALSLLQSHWNDQARQALIHAMDDADAKFAARAIRLLIASPDRPKHLVPVLLKILRNDSSDSDVRAAAVSGLGKYGSKGLEGAPDLVRLVTDRKAPEPLRIAAMDALVEIPFEDNEFSTTLRGLLKDRRESPSIRGRAAARFIKLNINVKSIIPDLLEVLTETKGATRNSSSSQMVTLRTGTIRHLKNLKAGKQAVDAIVAILGDRNEDVSARQMALDALSSVGSEELAIKAVTKVLSSLPKLPTIFDDHVSLQMIEYLSLKGPAARDAVAVLQIIANQSESRRLREASKDAIEQIVQQD